MRRSQGDGGGGVPTYVAGVSGSQPNVAAFSPPCSPGVLDLPEGAAVAHQEDSVVDGSAAVVEDAGQIRSPVGGVDSHGDRSYKEEGGHARAPRGHTDGGDFVYRIASFAGLLEGDVGVSGLVADAVHLHVVVGVVHPPSVAALVSIAA